MNELIVAVETYRHKCIGSVIRCASAFGAKMVAIVGSPDFSTHGAHGAQSYMPVMHFYYWSELQEYAIAEGISIVGISHSAAAHQGSISVDDYKFTRSTCIVVGDKDGLTKDQKSVCQSIVHVCVPLVELEHLIPFDSKLAICLQQVAVQNGFEPSSHDQEKHILSTSKKVGIIRYVSPNAAEKVDMDSEDQFGVEGLFES